jgi:hypothetical protein
MLYILAVPDWPVGRFTQIHKVPLSLIRFLLSVNFAVTLLVTVMCCYVLIRVPNQVRKNHGPEIVKLETHAEEAKEDQRQTQNQIKTIREETTAKILKEGMDLLKTAITLAGTMATVYTSFKVLQKDRPTEANPQPRQHEERR